MDVVVTFDPSKYFEPKVTGQDRTSSSQQYLHPHPLCQGSRRLKKTPGIKQAKIRPVTTPLRSRKTQTKKKLPERGDGEELECDTFTAAKTTEKKKGLVVGFLCRRGTQTWWADRLLR